MRQAVVFLAGFIVAVLGAVLGYWLYGYDFERGERLGNAFIFAMIGGVWFGFFCTYLSIFILDTKKP